METSLNDEPSRLLSHLPATNANFQVAVQLLTDRYENKRVIAHAHLEAIFEFKPIRSESADQLRKLVSIYVENTMALEAMGLDVDSADYIWVYHIANKLDTETRRQWVLNKAGNDFQTMESLKKFLEERARALDFSSSKDSCKVFRHDKCDKKQTQQIYYSQSEAPQACPKCGTQHSIYSCDAFRASNLDGKLEFVKNKRLCFNCLKPDHSIKDCKSKSTCRTCKKLHHTLLHRQHSRR